MVALIAVALVVVVFGLLGLGLCQMAARGDRYDNH
jgi:hypothetical protein